jgi:hypothetical protein
MIKKLLKKLPTPIVQEVLQDEIKKKRNIFGKLYERAWQSSIGCL